jgi:hypothetical protein
VQLGEKAEKEMSSLTPGKILQGLMIRRREIVNDEARKEGGLERRKENWPSSFCDRLTPM